MTGVQGQWQWWISGDAENYQGPFASREEASAEARGQAMGEHLDERGVTMLRFYITEARQDPLVLADWIDVEEVIDRAEEALVVSDRVGAECDKGPWFDYPAATFADLEARIKQACTDWQTAHGLVFTCRTFSASRNEETILIPAREDEGVPDPAAPSSSGLYRTSEAPSFRGSTAAERGAE
jgi:hypothetical protein